MSRPILLSTMRVREKAEVVSIHESEAEQLAGYGIYPGAVITVHQRFPSFVLKTDETELAVENAVARKIKVRRLL